MLQLSYVKANPLQEVKIVRRWYGNGAHDCPFCSYSMLPGERCQNPACEINSTPARIAEVRAQLRREHEEEVQRRQISQWAIERRRSADEQERTYRQTERTKAAREGFCPHCLFDHYGRIKRVRHRKACPKKQRGRDDGADPV